jgi:hypothetical protein
MGLAQRNRNGAGTQPFGTRCLSLPFPQAPKAASTHGEKNG